MPTPTRDQLLAWAENYVQLWNAGDKPAWAANWRAVAPGEFRMLDPVGTPEKRGFEACALKAWDLFQPHVRFRVVQGSRHVCGNEVAWLLENSFPSEPSRPPHLSIETYRFEANGDVVIRTYYEVPAHADGSVGELFKTYLPGPR
ncbi:MAG TPA: hypothetical protein VFT98_12650 [Myxococcota bacterium]|nr:hypothetical protein [Myxococcota bacterium]